MNLLADARLDQEGRELAGRSLSERTAGKAVPHTAEVWGPRQDDWQSL